MIKIVGKNFYAHKSNLQEILDKLSSDESSLIKTIIENNTEIFNKCSVIKFNRENQVVSFIESPDWDIANEPLVGNSYCFHSMNDMKIIKGGTKIYHNKWQFVNNDYTGFDIEEAKERTKKWNSIPNIKEKKKFIGTKTYWLSLLKEYNIEP